MNVQTVKISVATVLAIASFGVTIKGYGALTSRTANQILLDSLLTTDQSFLNFTYKGLCLGHWNGILKPIEQRGYRYKGSGKFLATQGNNTIIIKATLDMAFNELDQLGATIFQFWNLSNPNLKITFGTKGTNPIYGEFFMPQATTPFSLKAAFPGPYTLFQIDKRHYGIQSPSSQLALRLPPFLNDFQIKETKEDQVCALDPKNSMDIGEFSQQNLKSYGTMMNSIPFLKTK